MRDFMNEMLGDAHHDIEKELIGDNVEALADVAEFVEELVNSISLAKMQKGGE